MLQVEHFTVLDDDWDIEEKAVAALHEWGLPGVPLSHPMHLLSGGEKTKVFLAGIALHSPSFILMDELWFVVGWNFYNQTRQDQWSS